MKLLEKFNKKLVTPLILLLILCSSILFYNLDKQYMWTDEIFSFHAAEMIIEKGEALYDSGLIYRRAPVYHHILAASMELFGNNEFGSRVVNIPFAIGTMMVCFFFVLEVFKKSKHRYLYATASALLMLSANFTIAGVRETRMYTAATFFLTTALFSFYKSFLDSKDLRKFGPVVLNPLWAFIFIVSFGLAYNTHAISAIFALGVLVFLLIASVLNKRKEVLVAAVILALIGFLSIYLIYGTIDFYQVFMTLSPPWGNEAPNLLYYPVLLVRNFPGIFILSPLVLWTVYKNRKPLNIYLLTIFLTYLLFISIQTAQNERYLSPILPTLIILAVISVGQVMESISKKAIYYYLLIATLVLGSLAHLHLFTKELNEIETYTPTSISIHKKFEFNSLIDYLKEQDLTKFTVIADDQSAYTLYQKGIKADFIIVPENKDIFAKEIVNGKVVDIYFNIPFLSYKEDFSEYLETHDKRVLVILRNYEDYEGIEEKLDKVNIFEKPRLYLEKR